LLNLVEANKALENFIQVLRLLFATFGLFEQGCGTDQELIGVGIEGIVFIGP
jgi:hypothetical protein